VQESTGLFPKETFLTAIRQALKEKCAMIPLNEQAFDWGAKMVRSA
jgi:Pyruvate/2-oxoacid:ferredoxin oxidoreductase gamma subunit